MAEGWDILRIGEQVATSPMTTMVEALFIKVRLTPVLSSIRTSELLFICTNYGKYQIAQLSKAFQKFSFFMVPIETRANISKDKKVLAIPFAYEDMRHSLANEAQKMRLGVSQITSLNLQISVPQNRHHLGDAGRLVYHAHTTGSQHTGSQHSNMISEKSFVHLLASAH